MEASAWGNTPDLANTWLNQGADIASYSAPAAAQPSWFENIWGGITSPFVAAGKAMTSPDVGKALGQSLYEIIITKAGLKPKAQVQANGTTTIQYERPGGGVPAPTPWYSFIPGLGPSTINDVPRSSAATGISIGVVVALLAAVVVIVLISRK